MGTKVHYESLFPGYHHSMRDLNNESNGCRLPLFYNDNKASANDHYSNGFQSQTTLDVVRRTMLEHEAVFKTQVLELHRVYRIQKDMMDELKRKEMNQEFVPMEASFSSQATNDDFRRWKVPPLGNSVYDIPSTSVVEDNGHSRMVVGQVPCQNGASSKNVEVRPKKIRKHMIDLCLPANEYIDGNEEVVELKDHRVCGTSSQFPSGYSSRSNGLADLNEPVKAQETNEFSYSIHSRDGEFQGHKALNSGSVKEHVPVTSLPKAWLHQPLRTDHYNGTQKSATPFLQPAKPLDSSSQPRVTRLPNYGTPSLWRERTFIDLEADTDTNTSHETASHQPRHLYPYNPPDSSVPWNHLYPSFSFPQRVASSQRYPVLNLSETLTGNAQKQGDRLQFESNSRFGNSIRANHNMFYSECSSSSKSKFAGTGYNYPNGGRSDYSSANPLMDSDRSDIRDLNLNVTFSNTSVVEVRKDKEHLAILPWLNKPKSACSSEMADEKISAERDKVHKVRMLDINEPCDPLSDEDQQTEEQSGAKFSGFSMCQIDLNLSVSEDDEDKNRSVLTNSRLKLKAPMIDLEAPAILESDDDDDMSETQVEKPPEFEKTAAETIVAISSACLDRDLEVVDPESIILHWFAETVENLDIKPDTFSTNHEEVDDFMSMTLKLPELTEEEYIPKPLVPKDLNFEETSRTTSQRPRRGNTRKAKQKRDFQRDIIPGLLSLTKHEVTEDIEMFDGFMRANGSSWTPKKKTGTRGRPRRVVTVPETVCVGNQNKKGEIEMRLGDRRFAGWSNMTRRPRRQRCSLTRELSSS